MDCAVGEIVEFGRLSMRDWAQLIEGEHQPFGAICAGFAFRPKDHHVGIRDADGRLLAAAGWSLVDIEIAGAGALQVVGVGALIVRQDLRGRGLAEPIMDRVRERIRRTPGAYRMLLCEPHLEPLYARRGYRPVEDPVWV
ncbi:MAG TPA: GNAT family N-acetyltransferase, partial [Solirubrobacteraceae bacterium]|nr:GNAT family N-acetyltransferase [Solirubrobacteraceae bacterium]